MCGSRSLNNKINRLHERCLRIVYSNKKSIFKDLPERDSSVSTHHQNIKFLANEMYQLSRKKSSIVKEIFQFRDAMPYQLTKQTDFQIPPVLSVVNGTESLKFLEP